MKHSEIQSNKIKGLIFGQAIGDALGLGTEFLSKDQIAQYYPNGYHFYDQIIQDKHRSRWEKGSWTDDTDMFLCIANSLIAKGQVDELDIASRFKHWMDTSGMGLGLTTYRVMSLPQYTKFPAKGAEIVWKLKKKDIAPNGALMRNGIVCAYNYWDEPEVLHNCERICQLTHFDPRCVDSCKIMAHIILGELNHKPLSWPQLHNIMQGYDPRIIQYINNPKVDISLLQLDEPKSMGYTLKALNAGIWSYFNAASFEEGILRIINEGGDADTNACIAGSILGSKFGFKAVPEHWVQALLKHPKLDFIAGQFIEIISQK